MSDVAPAQDPLARKQALLDKQAAARQKKQEESQIDGEEGEPVIEEPAAPVVPMREDMISNAIKFLSHENVKRTPLVRRVAFLEKKGLTNEEITEALRRVGEAPSSTTPATPTSAPVQTYAQAPPIPQRVQYAPVPAPPPPQSSTFKVVATSVVLTLSAAGGLAWLYNSFFRKQLEQDKTKKKPITREIDFSDDDAELKDTENSEIPKPTLQASMSELVQVMKTQQNEVNDTLKMVHSVLSTPTPQNTRSTTDQINVKELTNAITELHSLLKSNKASEPRETTQTPINPVNPKLTSSFSSSPSPSVYNTTPMRSTKGVGSPNTNTQKETVSPVANSSSAPKSFSEVMKMVQSGEPLPNVKQIDDSPINPSAVVTASATEKPLKPWEKRRQESLSKAKLNSEEPQKPAYLSNFRSSNESSPKLPTQKSEKSEKAEKMEKEEEPVEIVSEEIPIVSTEQVVEQVVEQAEVQGESELVAEPEQKVQVLDSIPQLDDEEEN
eukprot:CAMPEP_0117014858 /NCGR_PEP_ID=MMETSP0472-20121206/11978_1 /TAXON_ID=693140 ORGANISM="Tiarina fusus, Strain LIS" /NCGR_SAMPLE_ID=MMETSP0472 /ASSEMBLY_ACC=CAM_ASM_000603 /LENGTH=496 /DNA_ID=CAMNT_0004718527 /DNA_START=18 /DNA_END=1508 /DNA_ORIENTATION=+